MKEDLYYLGNCTDPPVELTIRTGHTTVIQKLPWDADLQDLIHAFFTACVGVTFSPDGVLETMKEYAEQHLPENNEEDENKK